MGLESIKYLVSDVIGTLRTKLETKDTYLYQPVEMHEAHKLIPLLETVIAVAKTGETVILFSTENDATAIAEIIISLEGKFLPLRFSSTACEQHDKTSSGDHFKRLWDVLDIIEKLPIYIDDTPDLSNPERMREKLCEIRQEGIHGIALMDKISRNQSPRRRKREAWQYKIHNNSEIDELLRKGDRTAEEKEYLCSAVMHDAVRNNLSRIKYFIENGISPDLSDCNGDSILHYAVAANADQVIKYIISVGGRISISNKLGSTLLHYAVQVGNKEIVKYFLKNGIDPNRKDFTGKTALEYAAIAGNTTICNQLLYFVDIWTMKSSLNG